MAFSASASASAPASNHGFACPIAHTVLPHQFLCLRNGANAAQSLSSFKSAVSVSDSAVRSMGAVMPSRRKLGTAPGYSCQASLSSTGIVDDVSDVGGAAAAAAAPETLARVVSIVARQLGTSEGSVTPDSKFQELGADSLDQVEIVMALEEEFDISVSENGAQSISTVQDAANLIQIAISEKPC